ncbi:hypothetical protein SNE40_002903 [Patella caerulea]|uniref:DUF4211 domain-containing protein n=1 Tax=Patella caerulea TaxID=87958 RepID=A0AAN8Q0B5_PATCE
MDPNHWSNYNSSYGRLTSGGLPTSHGGINFPILDQATISSGLGLPAGLSAHGGLTTRSLPGIPNYHGHPLHNPVSQFLDPINSLQAATFVGQSPYKPITSTASPFSLESSSRSVSDMNVGYSGSRYSVSTPTSSSSLSNPTHKSGYFQTEKESGTSFSSSQAAAEGNLKGWGLSNFVQFTELSPPFTTSVQSSQLAPPPAHSSGSSGRMNRNPYPSDNVFPSRSKSLESSQHPLPPPSPYLTSNVSRSRSTSNPVVSTPPEIEDLSSHSQMYGSYSSLTSTGYSSLSSNNPIYSSQLHPDMNYDPVSPVTPVSHSPQHQNTDPFNTVSLQDLESIETTGHIGKTRGMSRKDLLINEHGMDKLNKRMIKESSSLFHHMNARSERSVVNSPLSNIGAISQQKSSSVHSGKSNLSPMEQSPISVGSPQSTITCSTYTPAPTPVQAVPDSTTKPKSRKPRKKKSESNPSYIPNVSQTPYTPAINQPPNQNFASDMSQPYRNTLHHPPYSQSSSSRSASDTPLSPIHRQIQGNMAEQLQSSANLGDEMVPMHRIPNMTEDILSRHSSISSLPENAQSSIHSSPATDHLPNLSSHSVHPQISPLVNTSGQLPVNHMIEASILSRQTHDTGQRSCREPGSLISNVFTENEMQPNQNQFDINGYAGQTFLEELNSQTNPNIESFTGDMMVDRQNFHTTMLEMANYGSHYGMAPGMEQVDMNNPMHLGTIDESTFTSLLDQDSAARRYRAPEPKLTCSVPVEQDDELAIFCQPPPRLQADIKLNAIPQKVAPPHNAFNESFINFVKGKKPETLSSVNSVPHKKPMLPKYIPEPQRRIIKKTPEPKEEDTMSFSEEEEESDQKMSDLLLTESNSDSDVSAEYTVKKQNKSTKKIPPLVIKKKLIQNKVKVKPVKLKKSRKSFDLDLGVVSDPYVPVEVEVSTPRTLISRKAKEKALEKSAKKKTDLDVSVSEESEQEYIPFTKKPRTGSKSTVDYDSDEDPAWMPIELDLRQQGEDEGEIRPRRNRNRQKSGGGSGGKQKSRSQTSRRKTVDSLSDDSFHEAAFKSEVAAKTFSKSTSKQTEVPFKCTFPSKSKGENPMKLPSVKIKSSKPYTCVSNESSKDTQIENEEESFQVGRFLIEKKDLHNYETYPIWRIEQGGMIHKYEIFPEEGNIRHMSVSTYSSWMPIMKDQFIPIRVCVLMEKNNKSIVEVLDEYKPKPPTDGSLENKYDEDPLVDLFNVYLQIFLSQALEPSFLRAIKDSQEHFYLVPLDKVDKMIDRKLDEIDRTVKWKPYFKVGIYSVI